MKTLGILIILIGLGFTILESWSLIKLNGFVSLDPIFILLLLVPCITNSIIGISIIKKLQEKYIHIMFFIMYICMTFSWGIKTIMFFIPFHIIYILIKRNYLKWEIKMKKRIWIPVVICIFLFITWATTFLFVVQPIGAIPEGTTVWMFKPDRLLTEKVVPFICSADGMLLDGTGSVNLFGRVIMMAAIMKSAKGKIINLPYSKTLYLISTGGVEFKR